jgi:autophagy-related protein 11
MEEQVVARIHARGVRSHDVSKQLHSQVDTLVRILEQMGFALIQQDGHLAVQRASKVNASSSLGESIAQSGIVSARPDASLLPWMQAETPEEEESNYAAFIENLSRFDFSIFGEAVIKRVKDLETYARKYLKESRTYRDRYHRVQSEAHEKIAYRSFKEGDLALFLPTRNQAIRSWAAFNINAPHNFLREQDSHKLDTRDWLLARITKIEERVVDLSKSLNSAAADRNSLGDASDGASLEDDNPFELSDGLRWYLIDAVEEKPGAPATPGISKSTVASAHVDAKGSIRLKRPTEESTVAQTLSKSLDSRRNSSNSKRGTPTPSHKANDSASDIVRPADADTGSQTREAAPIFDEVRRGLLRDP